MTELPFWGVSKVTDNKQGNLQIRVIPAGDKAGLEVAWSISNKH